MRSGNTDDDPSEIVSPLKARRDFIKYKQDTQKSSTARKYKFPTRDFIEHCRNAGVESTGDITRRHVADWIDRRRGEVAPITVHNNAKDLRVFFKWLARRELVDWELHERMEIPAVPEAGDVNDDVLREGHAETVLDYLGTYHYASVYHALFYTMWHATCRVSGAISLDVSDFEPRPHDDNVLKFRNRNDSGTPLKNNSKSERNVTISDSLATVLNDYLASRRSPITEDSGREPLFTTDDQRMYRQRAYKNIVAFTRPCVCGNTCPHNREIDECEAAQRKQKAANCPSSLSTHPIRKGAITHHIYEGWPKEALAERADVSVSTLEKHYDFRTNERKRQNRRKYLHD